MLIEDVEVCSAFWSLVWLLFLLVARFLKSQPKYYHKFYPKLF